MSKCLIIAEKPSVAMNIASAIGDHWNRQDGYTESARYVISWCVGHLVGLAEPKAYDGVGDTWSFKDLPIIPEHWKLTVHKETRKQYQILVSLLKRSDLSSVVCATDAGREGELIFRYVFNTSGCKKPVSRLWVSSMERSAILDGLRKMKPDSDYDNLFQAGFGRARADWLVGMNATELFTLRYGGFISVGRVQTPTLAAIVDREDKIKNFVSEPFFTVDIADGECTIGSSERFSDKGEALSALNKVDEKDAVVTKAVTQKKTRKPPKLFDLTSLQREANKIFGYTAQKTLDFTQDLYEKKLVTYPRTDSNYLTTDMRGTAADLFDLSVRSLLKEGVSISYKPDVDKVINDKKVSDHHAIIPTEESFNTDISSLPSGQLNIYRLVMKRLIESMGQPAQATVTDYEYTCEGVLFKGKSTRINEYGYLDAEDRINKAFWNKEPSNKGKSLPDYKEGQTISRVAASLNEGKTTPPKRFTEDSLLAFMETAGNDQYDENSDAEKKGIGTPATRASIIEKLVERKFVRREKKNLVPTATGEVVVSVVPEELKSAKLTAEWEMKLKEVEKGNMPISDFMRQIEDYVRTLVEGYNQRVDNTSFSSSQQQVLGKCPKCGSDVMSGRYGPYCKQKCGMYLAKVRGKALTDKQVEKLLSGKVVVITVSGKKFDVFPQVESYSYQKDEKHIEGYSFKSTFHFDNNKQ